MTYKIIFAAFIALATLSGCATSNVTYGRDFASQNVQKIVKGKTTTAELVALVGQPFMKTPISAKEERWHYQYTSSVSEAQSYVIVMDVKTSTLQKVLDVIIENGIVTNYTFTQNLNPTAVTLN